MGARILVPAKCDLPAIYYLINVPARHAYEALTVWRKGDRAGIRLARIIPPYRGTPNPHMAFLCRLGHQAAAG